MGNSLATGAFVALQLRVEERRNARNRMNTEVIRSLRVKFTQQHIDEGKKDCSVCLKDYVLEQNLVQCPKCSQLFHEDCILRNLRTISTCPQCRYELVVRRNWERKFQWSAVCLSRRPIIWQAIHREHQEQYYCNNIHIGIVMCHISLLTYLCQVSFIL